MDIYNKISNSVWASVRASINYYVWDSVVDSANAHVRKFAWEVLNEVTGSIGKSVRQSVVNHLETYDFKN